MTFPDPKNADALDAMFEEADPGHRSGDRAVMLKEVEMTPSHCLKVVGLTGLAALREEMQGASISGQSEMEFIRFLERIQLLFHQIPGWRKDEAKGENFIALHGS